MNFSLTPNLEIFIRDRVASGDYNNASEVVREALRLLKQQEEVRAARIESLRQAVMEGEQAIAKGDMTEISSPEVLETLFAKL